MLLGEEIWGFKFLLVCKWLLESVLKVRTERACRSREDGERIKKGNLRVLMSSAGGLTSSPSCDPEAECWLSRNTKQFAPHLCWDGQESLGRTRLAVNCQMAEQSKYLLWSPHCLGKGWTCIPAADLGGLLPPLPLASVTPRVNHGSSPQGFIDLNQPPLWPSSKSCPVWKGVLTAFLWEWPCLTFHVMSGFRTQKYSCEVNRKASRLYIYTWGNRLQMDCLAPGFKGMSRNLDLGLGSFLTQ